MLVRAGPNALRHAKETQIVHVVFKIVKIGVGFRQRPNFRSLVWLFGIRRLYELADKNFQINLHVREAHSALWRGLSPCQKRCLIGETISVFLGLFHLSKSLLHSKEVKSGNKGKIVAPSD